MSRNLFLLPACGEDSLHIWLYNPTEDHDPQFKNWGLESMDELKVNPKESCHEVARLNSTHTS